MMINFQSLLDPHDSDALTRLITQVDKALAQAQKAIKARA